MKTDFHSHFLPGIDDGAKTPEQSVGILRYLKSRGIETVCATPHFAKHDADVERFIVRRRDALSRLYSYMDGNGVERSELPEIVLGAEVRLHREFSEREDLAALCYEGTRYILIELPFRKFEGWELEEVYNIMYQLKVKPVMAHINRYLDYYSKSEFSDMFYNGDFTIQLNTECVTTLQGLSFMKKTLKRDLPIIFGSDIHDPSKVHDSGLGRTQKLIEKLDAKRSSELESVERSVRGVF